MPGMMTARCRKAIKRTAIVLLLLCLLSSSAALAARQVSLPEVVTDTGTQVVVCLSISDIADMIAADIDIAYDAGVLDAVGVQATGLLSGFSVLPNYQDDGWIRIAAYATQPSTGGGCAINITFDPLERGCSLLHISRASLNEDEIASQTVDGMVTVRGWVDQDGDGVMEAAGDCSDRFDWVHPGASEICNGADDDCDGSYDEDVVCPCGAYCAPRPIGFWKSVCLGSSTEEVIDAGDVDLVNDFTTFSSVATPEDICGIIVPADTGSCTAAEAEFMTLLLNLSTGRLCSSQPVDASGTTAPDVGQAAGEVDGLLANPSRTAPDCLQAAGISAEISEGDAVPGYLGEEIHLLALLEDSTFGATILSWEQPDAMAAGRPLRYLIQRAPDAPQSWSTLGESGCYRWFPALDGNPATGEVVFYQVIGISP